jgi:SAM-dependent methyltransferase
MSAEMRASDYDAWYQSPRGRWIGDNEYRLLQQLLGADPGESLIDVGCGTGYFTRRFAQQDLHITGLDLDAGMVDFARSHAAGRENYVLGDARQLPFPDRAFDLCVSVTSLCFIPEQSKALREMLRVTRRRFAIGLLNRHSLLYRQKGARGGSGAYRGAHWHTAAELRALFAQCGVTELLIRSCVFLPGGGRFARLGEHLLPDQLLLGAFLVVAGSLSR